MANNENLNSDNNNYTMTLNLVYKNSGSGNPAGDVSVTVIDTGNPEWYFKVGVTTAIKYEETFLGLFFKVRSGDFPDGLGWADFVPYAYTLLSGDDISPIEYDLGENSEGKSFTQYMQFIQPQIDVGQSISSQFSLDYSTVPL